MNNDTNISKRKVDHIEINLNEEVSSSISSGFDSYRFVHQALPEINLGEVDLSLSLLGKKLLAPIMISSMTGGAEKAAYYNELFARAAQEYGLALGLGSQRAAIENPALTSTFEVRKYASDALIFANLGAVQLNRGYGVKECQQAVDMAGADALILHLNPLQEALQLEGDTQFSGLLKKIEMVCSQLPVPVIVKEVGWGINQDVARKLLEAGVTVIDVAGAGGTSWSQVEMYRQVDPERAVLASKFRDWGIPTVDCLKQIHDTLPNALIFASGGIQDGIDLAKSLALGATMGGMAGPFLRAAENGYEGLSKKIRLTKEELTLCMFACGKKNLTEFDSSVLVSAKN
ncbi:MAG: type 2 isopentenyl-diphosphate Delta-isomerase [Anaerolineaceae bacterium]